MLGTHQIPSAERGVATADAAQQLRAPVPGHLRQQARLYVEPVGSVELVQLAEHPGRTESHRDRIGSGHSLAAPAIAVRLRTARVLRTLNARSEEHTSELQSPWNL